MQLNKFFLFALVLSGCIGYQSPDRSTWQKYLSGASFMDMTETAKTAKLPIYMGHGGKIITASGELSPNMQYGDKNNVDNTILVNYMSNLEYELYNSLNYSKLNLEYCDKKKIEI